MGESNNTDVKVAHINKRATILVAIITAIGSVIVTLITTGTLKNTINHIFSNNKTKTTGCFEDRSKSGSIRSEQMDKQLYSFLGENSQKIKSISVSGVSLFTTTTYIKNHFDDMVKLKDLKVVTIDTSSFAFKYHVKREVNYAPPLQKARTSTTIENIRELSRKSSSRNKRINIFNKAIDFPVDEKIVLIELIGGCKICFVKLYPFRTDTKINSLYLKFDQSVFPNEYTWYKKKFDQYYSYSKAR